MNTNYGFNKVLVSVFVSTLVIIGSIVYIVITAKPTFTLGEGILQANGSYQFSLPAINSYNYVVDWGDGKVEHMDTKCPLGQSCGLAPWITHTFPTSPNNQTYRVTVTAEGHLGIKDTARVEVAVSPENNTVAKPSSERGGQINFPALTPEERWTASCVNEKFGYQLTYPAGWKVWTRGGGEAISATCSENLALYLFAEDLFGMPLKNQINLMVFTRDNQVKEFWQGINSLDDYVRRMSAWRAQKETTIGGERLVWLGYNQELRLVAYRNSVIYEFDIYSVDSAILEKFLASFEFTK